MKSMIVLCALLASPEPAKKDLGVEIPRDQKAFLERVHQANQVEIRLGELAASKASDRSVRDFADMMVRDHRAADEKVLALAEAQKMTLEEPKPANDVERKTKAALEANTRKLEALSGRAFDQSYMAMMVAGHDMVVSQLMLGQQQFGKGELGNLLGELLPKVTAHRDAAYRILGELKAQPGVGGAGQGHQHH